MNKKSKFLEPWLSNAVVSSWDGKKATGRLIYNPEETLALPKECPQWQREKLEKARFPVTAYETPSGPVWVVSPFLKPEKQSPLQADPWLEPSPLSKIRDAAGQALQLAQRSGVPQLEAQVPSGSEEITAFLSGLEIAAYHYKPPKEEKPLSVRLLKGAAALSAKDVTDGETLGWCVNVARHLVNLPSNELNPVTFSKIVKELCEDISSVEVSVWEKDRLKKERCHLLLAVGSASATPPCLVHLRYRPGKKSKPVALVGKGITFDSGGLDIKSASGMRLMKKDMGGAASVFGAFLWAAVTDAPVVLDAYLSLAENAIGSQAFRPGDVYVSRGGQTVEITNTDAEGRLVLADALDVAVTQKEEPATVIDVATLTGCRKGRLGRAVARVVLQSRASRRRASHALLPSRRSRVADAALSKVQNRHDLHGRRYDQLGGGPIRRRRHRRLVFGKFRERKAVGSS